jgi:hypothetical protein
MSRSRRSAVRRPRATLAATCAAALLLASACAHSASDQTASGAIADAPDAGTRLDLAGARLQQIASGELALDISTYGAWEAADVKPSATRALCVWLRNELARTPGSRLCVVADAHAASGMRLRQTLLDHRGRSLGIRDLSTIVRHPQPGAISARVSPALLRLVPGRYRWQVRSLSNSVEDRLPDRGELALPIALSTAPAARERCFGAASHDPRRRCENPMLRLAVVPSPDDAAIAPNSPCHPVASDGPVKPCEFGVPAADASATVALVGDSHAEHWRATLDQVAWRKGWRGVSITHSGCPLSRARSGLVPKSRSRACMRWNRQVPRWLAKHPQIHTVLVAQHYGVSVVVAPGGTARETRAHGYAAAWKALPRSVKRIVVIRDTPRLGYRNGCVARVHVQGRNAGLACALPRAAVLPPDAAVVAARRLRSRRVRVIDMTPFFCGARRCPPVIGGALVYKDYEHTTTVFATTLGPFLQRALDGL